MSGGVMIKLSEKDLQDIKKAKLELKRKRNINWQCILKLLRRKS
jgi:hypothetical protein